MAIHRGWKVLLLSIGLILARAGRKRLQFVARGSIGWEGAPLSIGAFFHLLRHTRLISLLVIYLHHIYARQILLHLFSVFDALAVNNVIDVLDFVRTHTS